MSIINRRTVLAATACMAAGLNCSAQDAETAAPLFTVGKVEVRPSFSYSATLDDNIFLQHKGANKEDDLVHTFTPGVALGAGDYRGQNGFFMAANYSANFLVFQDNDGANAVTHNAGINIGGGERLSWRFGHSLVSDADADVQNLAAGGRVRRDIHTSTLSTIYDLSDKTDLEARFASIYSDYSSATTFDTWRGQGTVLLDYEMTAKIHYALGGSLGYDQVDGFNNSIFEQINSRLVWTVSPKLALRTGVGVEFRQFQGASLDRANLIFDAAADWKISALTVASVGTARGVSPSNSLGNQTAVRTSVTGQLTHKVGTRYTASAIAGYSFSDASANGVTTNFSQEDNYWFLRPSLAVKLMDRAAAVAFYQFRRNDSNALANRSDFTNHQVGLSLSYAF
ncbi:MAG: outer membrane beta-barrel protein [Verrucomicrobiae bacterium]|nr:outer membrane beta-barrel protein [Verrucomicrobiae bacterium]